MAAEQALTGLLIYVLFPLWLLAGGVDWLCHRVSQIESTSGTRESWQHLLMFGEVAAGVAIGLWLEINALALLLLFGLFLLHQLTSFWDTHYSGPRRHIGALEQQAHSFLELVPLMAIIAAALLHGELLARLLALAPVTEDFHWRWREPAIPGAYQLAVGAGLVLALALILEELRRGQQSSAPL